MNNHGHLYAIEFSTGDVKVGRTIDPQRRIDQHRLNFSTAGTTISRTWNSEKLTDARSSEAELIDYCRDHGTCVAGRELFEGVNFEDVVAHAENMDHEAVSTQRAPRRRSEATLTTAAIVTTEMRKRGMSGRDLAKAIDRDFSVIYKKLKGERDITISELWAFAEAFNMDWRELLPSPESLGMEVTA